MHEVKTKDHVNVENKILLRIAREKRIDVSKLIGDEYQPLKEIANGEKRE